GYRVIGGGGVDDDQLEFAMNLAGDATEASPQPGSAVPGYEDDGDESSHRCKAFFSTRLYVRSASQRFELPLRKPASAATHRIIIPAITAIRSASAREGANHLRA